MVLSGVLTHQAECLGVYLLAIDVVDTWGRAVWKHESKPLWLVRTLAGWAVQEEKINKPNRPGGRARLTSSNKNASSPQIWAHQIFGVWRESDNEGKFPRANLAVELDYTSSSDVFAAPAAAQHASQAAGNADQTCGGESKETAVIDLLSSSNDDGCSNDDDDAVLLPPLPAAGGASLLGIASVLAENGGSQSASRCVCMCVCLYQTVRRESSCKVPIYVYTHARARAHTHTHTHTHTQEEGSFGRRVRGRAEAGAGPRRE